MLLNIGDVLDDDEDPSGHSRLCAMSLTQGIETTSGMHPANNVCALSRLGFES